MLASHHQYLLLDTVCCGYPASLEFESLLHTGLLHIFRWQHQADLDGTIPQLLAGMLLITTLLLAHVLALHHVLLDVSVYKYVAAARAAFLADKHIETPAQLLSVRVLHPIFRALLTTAII